MRAGARHRPRRKGPIPGPRSGIDPRTVAGALGYLRDPSADVRRSVATVLGAANDLRSRRALTVLLADPSDRVRREAVLALGHRAAGPRDRTRLRAFLADPAARVRAGAAVALGRLRDRRAVPGLLERLDAPGTWEKPSVLVALGRIGDLRAVPALVRTSSSPVRWLRVCAIHALALLRAPEGRAVACAHLDDDAWSVRGMAASALGTVGTRQDVPALIRLADDPHPWARRGAVYALGCLGGPSACRTVRSALSDVSADVRLAAAWAVGELKDARATNRLLTLLATSPAPGGARARPPEPADPRATGAEDRLFETALFALSRIAGGRRAPRLARGIRRARLRVPASELDRPVRPAFPGRDLSPPYPTLRLLLAPSTGGPTGDRR